MEQHYEQRNCPDQICREIFMKKNEMGGRKHGTK